MALIWADNFEMYGTEADFLNGVYSNVDRVALERDSEGTYIRTTSGVGLPTELRMILPGLRTEVGQGGYLYMTSLPSSGDRLPSPLTWKSSSNAYLFSVVVLPTGQLKVVRGAPGSSDILGVTASPVITANQYVHIEGKVKVDSVGGSVELRVRGRPVLVLENIDTGSTPLAAVQLNNNGVGGGSTSYYWRHWTIWDNLGSVNNDFLGQVQAYWNRPVETREAGGWTSSANAPAHETLDKPSWANQLTASGNIVNNDTVRIQNVYYRWTSGSVSAGAGTSANPWLVALGVDTSGSLRNMYDAINATGTPGVTYTPTLIEHPLVRGFGVIDTAFCVTPKVEGTTTMTFSETGAATAWTSTTTFLLRVWDTIRMSVGYIPAVKATGSITFTGQPVVDETVTVNGEILTFKASAAASDEVTIGTDFEETASNLASTITSEVTAVVAGAETGVVTVEAISAGVSGNSITLSASASNVTVSGPTLSGGSDVTYPDPFVLGLSPLPDDVTSIRAVLPIVRAAKLDGGDGNIQVSFGTSDTSYDLGPDTPITDAMTYWGNATDPYVSEINPETGLPWTPGEFNLGARIRVARTK